MGFSPELKKPWYVVAKMFRERGCLCYKCKTYGEASSLPNLLGSLCDGEMQIILLDNPQIYAEYEPYDYIEDLLEFINLVANKKAS